MSGIPDRLAAVAEVNPRFLEVLRSAAAAQAEGPLDARTTTLIYLGALASLGAEESFKFHLKLALEAGITREEALQATLCTFTAAGITPILRVLDAFVETSDA